MPPTPTPVLLLQPPGTCSEFTRSKSLYPPLGLCQLAATVSPPDAVVLDADGAHWSAERTLSEVLAREPVLVGMTVTSYTLDLVERFARPLAARGIAVMVGGPHASFAPQDVLARCPSVRFVVRGEAEVIFPEIVTRARRGESLHGLAGVHERGREIAGHLDAVLRVDDLGALPMPIFDGLPTDAWWCPDARRRPLVTVATTRGCPHRCAFCSSPELLGRKVRSVPVPQVLDYLEGLVRDRGVREISFVDDVFTILRRRTLELCRGMARRKLDLTWFCNARADQVTEEIAAAMAEAGCHQVYLGFESGNQGILDRIQKGATVADLERGAELLARHGISRSVGFVVGLPGENAATVAQSIALARRVRPERIQFTRFTPLVGSPLGRDLSVTRGFHDRGQDQVSRWISECYAAVEGQTWGRESW
jgi:anaerobic magnesium-protoporphyrin IX monomethyl ester cyclase